MSVRKAMTKTELELFKQSVIRQYKKKIERTQKKPNNIQSFLSSLRKILPINIALGIVASILYVYFNGWKNYLILFLGATIWITIISTVLGSLVKKK